MPFKVPSLSLTADSCRLAQRNLKLTLNLRAAYFTGSLFCMPSGGQVCNKNTDTDTDRHEALIHVQSITRAATVFPIRVAKMHDFLALCRDADTRISIVSWYFINVLWYPYSSTRVPRSICKVWFMSIVPEYEYSFLVLEYHISYMRNG